MFEFKPLAAKDFPLLLAWLAKEHVKEWWNDGDDTLEKVARHYGANDDTARFVLLEIDGENEKSIGYFQYYFDDGETIGIDQFIGEEDYLNRGVGERAIKIFIEMITRRHRPKQIILDPSPDNKRAVRCYEKVGFKHYEIKQNKDGGLAYLMRLEISTAENQPKT